MLVITYRFKVNPGDEAAFEERFQNRVQLAEGMLGFIKWELPRPMADGRWRGPSRRPH
jgi:heme-degrading monooxygenase HmoA